MTRTQILAAVASNGDLRHADLRGLNLSRADLRFADLRFADLSGTDLSDADLSSANLSRANLTAADLCFANLSFADLSGADLRGAILHRAPLTHANLTGALLDYREGGDTRLLAVAEAALAHADALVMDRWHGSCGTTHCIAGWACHLDPAASEMEKTHGPAIAGCLAWAQRHTRTSSTPTRMQGPTCRA